MSGLAAKVDTEAKNPDTTNKVPQCIRDFPKAQPSRQQLTDEQYIIYMQYMNKK